MSGGTGPENDRLDQIRIRLEQITAAFESDMVTDREAGELAAEAAALTAEAAREAAAAADRLNRD